MSGIGTGLEADRDAKDVTAVLSPQQGQDGLVHPQRAEIIGVEQCLDLGLARLVDRADPRVTGIFTMTSRQPECACAWVTTPRT